MSFVFLLVLSVSFRLVMCLLCSRFCVVRVVLFVVLNWFCIAVRARLFFSLFVSSRVVLAVFSFRYSSRYLLVRSYPSRSLRFVLIRLVSFRLVMCSSVSPFRFSVLPFACRLIRVDISSRVVLALYCMICIVDNGKKTRKRKNLLMFFFVD